MKRCLAVAAAILTCAAPAGAEILEEIVANVNGEIITMTDLREREREIQAQAYTRYSGAELDRALEEMRKTILADMVNEKLLYQRAQRLGLDFEQVYNSAVENVKRQNNISSNQELQDLLKKQGMGIEEFRENILKYNVPDIMINIEVRQKISVTDAEVERFYEDRPEEFSHPDTYTFREIALLLKNHERKEALEIASRIVEEVAAGKDFRTLVGLHSESGSLDQGGLLDSVPAGELSAPIRDALDKLQPGAVSRPIETPLAILVLRLEKKEAAHRDPLPEVRATIESAVQHAKFEEQLKAFLKGLWAENHIEVSPKYRNRYPTDLYR